jgi:signal transduction histidine kinase
MTDQEEGKELNDALEKLERCCPGSTKGLNRKSSSKHLHLALLELERARKESDALFNSIESLIDAENSQQAFITVLEQLRNLISFDDAFVLRQRQETGMLTVVASTSSVFQKTNWKAGAVFNKVLSGITYNFGNITECPEWLNQSPEILDNVSSALHAPFNTKTEHAMCVCVSHQKDFFNKSHVKLLKRFSPLAGQILYNIEISERKEEKQINRIKRAYEQLKEETEQRKQAQESFIQAQKMEIVGRLAGGVAHDYNNILTAILGYSQIMSMKLDESNPMRSMVDDIHEAAERATDLTRQLLAFSRKQVMEVKIVSLNMVVENISKMLRRLIGEDIELQLKLVESTGNVKADPGQIEQVIMNLVINARDAMPDGGDLTIETGQVELDKQYAAMHGEVEPGIYTVLMVTDTGKGMSPEEQEKIFEPFFTTKQRGKGTGLGLATVYGIVHQHNGHIYVYSELGKGSTFKIYLPLESGSAEKIGRREIRTMPLGNETILIVDDDFSVRHLIRDTLEPLGYNILEAGNGEDALAVIKRSGEKIDMVVTDLIMPGMNGKELLQNIRAILPDIKSILMSGYTDDIVNQNGVDFETTFINKPILPVFLSNKVREILDTQTAAAQSNGRG